LKKQKIKGGRPYSKKIPQDVKKTNAKIREIRDEQVVLELPLPVAEVLAGIPEAVEELSREVGLMLVMSVIKSECEKIAGIKDAKNPQTLYFAFIEHKYSV